MSSPQLETFLARLYLDAPLREQFLRDPRTVANGAQLTAEEIEAMCNIDLAGLRMAAASFEHKRSGYRKRRDTLAQRIMQMLRRLKS